MSDSGQTQVSLRQMARLLKKFSVHNGDIVALKHQSENANQVAIERIIAALEQNRVSALVIVVKDFDDLTVLNEIEMNKRGWFRIDKMSRLRTVPTKPEEEVINEGQI